MFLASRDRSQLAENLNLAQSLPRDEIGPEDVLYNFNGDNGPIMLVASLENLAEGALAHQLFEMVPPAHLFQALEVLGGGCFMEGGSFEIRVQIMVHL